MIVTFISQCSKKSIGITRQILDAYANRIGDNTWQTVITLEGLDAVRRRLAQTARRTTAVSCHRIRGASRTELVWIVGNRRQFNIQGIVPVNRTQRNPLSAAVEDDWQFLPLIKVLVALAALFHDFGKAWKNFQTMLREPGKKDPVRHEWISLLLFKALTENKTDEQWISDLLATASSNTDARETFSDELIKKASIQSDLQHYPFSEALPLMATWIGWLIVTHHKLPQMDLNAYQDKHTQLDLHEILANVSRSSGYEKLNENSSNFIDNEIDWTFEHGLPLLSDPWCKCAQRWTKQARTVLPLVEKAHKSERLILILARLSLVTGDHNYSTRCADTNWKVNLGLHANTVKSESAKCKLEKIARAKPARWLNQKLDEHLVGVTKSAVEVGHLLAGIENDLPKANNIRGLRKPSPQQFDWQNKAVVALTRWRKDHELTDCGFFAINIASTGCGKTIANAKIMYALSDEDALRYNLALGLRTLTLQTGDEYRKHLKMDSTDLAVLIGSRAVHYLHTKDKQNADNNEQEDDFTGSESAVSLSDELTFDTYYSEYESNYAKDGLFSTVLREPKSRQLLYTPVVVSTVDHLISATESTFGGRHILPTLRLMSSDLVIDEIDDFDHADLPAISRLIHLVGMLGRKLMISSATIAPAIVEGLFHAYHEGWKIFANTRQRRSAVTVFWIDEFGNKIESVNSDSELAQTHHVFIEKRIQKLTTNSPVKRKAEILKIKLSVEDTNDENRKVLWYSSMLNGAIDLHRKHSFEDKKSGTFFSAGLIRVANVQPCIELTQYILDCELPDDVEVRVLPYHARQILLLRSEQEAHLNSVLNRKPGTTDCVDNPIVRRHLQATQKANVIFIVVSTPIEEVGRDHDFDWAVIEPSSMRSFIQIAGRVIRHRTITTGELNEANLLIAEYNLKAYLGNEELVFRYPGFECDKYRLCSHNLSDILDIKRLSTTVDAVPRIQRGKQLSPTTNLVDLEHRVLEDVMTNQDYRPGTPKGWAHCAYYLNNLSQQASRFRKSEKEEMYKLLIDDEKTQEMSFISSGSKRPDNLEIQYLPARLCERLWLHLNYVDVVRQHSEEIGGIEKTCRFLGEVSLPDRDGQREYRFIPEIGFSRIS